MGRPPYGKPPSAVLTDYRSQYEKYRTDEMMDTNPAQVNLNTNLEGKIQNPLAGIPRQYLLQDVDDFATVRGLKDILPLLRKGALVASDPSNYEEISGPEALSDVEVEVLRDEILHKWRQPFPLYMTIAICSIGAVVQGWDQTGTNGANLSFPEALNIDIHTTRGSFLMGLINAAPYIGSCFIGCWVSDPLNSFWGRRGTIFVTGTFCLLSVIGSGFVRTWGQLLVCRLLLGIGMGAKASTVPIYAAENSPAAIRGALVMSWQMYVAFGIFLGFCANLAVSGSTDIAAWRLQLGSAFIPAVPLVLGVYFCPESPRWYMKKGRYRDAYESLLRLRNNPILAARDLYYIHSQLELERHIVGQNTYMKRFFELFKVPRLRRATLGAFTVMMAQQLCGINTIAFYSTTIFVQAGASTRIALVASFGFGLINFIFAWPAIWTIDTYGRRSLLLFTFPMMALTILAVALCSLVDDQKGRLGSMSLFIYLFAIFYSPGEGPVPFTYSAEVFPLSHREVGMGFSVAINLFWAAALGITLPRMLNAFTVAGTFGFYAGLNIVALTMIFLWVPETKQRTLEELDYVFAVPTRIHMNYQLRTALPWWTNKYILKRKPGPLEPLYHFDSPTGHTQIDQLFAADKVRVETRENRDQPFAQGRSNSGFDPEQPQPYVGRARMNF